MTKLERKLIDAIANYREWYDSCNKTPLRIDNQAAADASSNLDNVLIEMEDEAQKRIDKPLIYLASPHWHSDWYIRQIRYELVKRAWMYFFTRGDLVFSPILHTHNVNLNHQQFEKYQELDERMISVCDELWVLRIEGTEKSRGVRSEIDYARKIGKTVRYWAFEVGVTGYPSEHLLEDLV